LVIRRVLIAVIDVEVCIALLIGTDNLSSIDKGNGFWIIF